MNKVCYTTIDTIIELLSVRNFCKLCGISTVYYYRLIKTKTRKEIFEMYCKITG